jgi:hypothetical protein
MYKDKDIEELYMEFEQNGWCQHICPACGNETDPVEPDASQAYCSICESLMPVEPLI